MKSVLLLIAATFLAGVQITFSQVVINKADFPMESSYKSTSQLEYKTNLEPPSTGEDISWDLTNLVTTHYIEEDFVDASNDEFYTEAINYIELDYALNDFIIPSKDFFKFDDQGYTKIGRRITEVEYPITQLTGGANDKLKIVGGNFPLEGRLDIIKFPLKYDDSWTESYKISTYYELTVEGFGLSNTPGIFFQTVSETRSVVGSGKLTLPNENGGIMTIDALLLKVDVIAIDSVYLGGQQAPEQLMAAFGLVQGNVTTHTEYFYCSPGYGKPVASYNMTSEYISYTDVSQVEATVGEEVVNLLSVYPNPVKSGSVLNIDDFNAKLANIELVDQTGKVVLENEISGSANLSIPNTISAGAYLLNSYDSNGTIISTNKIIIE